ncbi:Bgt-5277 [Blumeria graminis f. sp. tritici]|uniref:Low-affinity phosphate transporter n=3 Tax=Blumeria graminis f. sp. tritici TaxID=62690 RepID=A0A656KG66_BLUGR|nr:Low-affinity phosphate transporter [Blumeria graminis f. sp. tritici 96224]VDB93056.1 Bgt-5277 [Blumeria graminis f. sp. tritici]
MTLNTSALAAKSQKFKDKLVQTFVFPKSPTKDFALCKPSSTVHQEYELTSYNDIRLRKENVRFDSNEALNLAERFNHPIEDGDMKFSHSIQFNAVPDWGNHYIAYSNLKKLIYQLEKSLYKQNSDDVEHALLISLEEPDEIFKKSLDAELEKITSFYLNKELEIFQETADLLQEAGTYESGLEQHEAQEPSTSNFPKQYRDRPRTTSLAQNYLYRPQAIIGESIDEGTEYSEESNDNTALLKSKNKSPERRRSLPYDSPSHSRPENRHRRKESFEFLRFNRRLSQISDDDFESDSLFYSAGNTLKKRTISLFVQLCELKSFVQLNKTGFVKVLKKYDKIMNRNLKDDYISTYVSATEPFLPSTAKNIENKIEVVEQIFANLVTNGDLSLAKKELRLNLRQHVVWERNTVWREMIGLERKAQAVHLGLRRTILGVDNRPDFARLQGDDDVLGSKQGFMTRYGRLYLPQVLMNSSFLFLIAIVLIFIILLRLPMNLQIEEQNCLAMLVFVSLLWATEAIPLFVTALIIPFLCVVLRIVRSDEVPHYRLNPSDATKFIFAAMWTPVIMLLLGGFTIAAALSKYDIARRIATFVLSKAGNNPNVVLITNMFVAAFASMWISNVAAPVLCFSIIQVCLLQFYLLYGHTLGWLTLITALTTKYSSRVSNVESAFTRYCTCIKYRRYAIAYRLSSKHRWTTDHGTPPILGGLVFCSSSHRNNFYLSDLAHPSSLFPSIQWNNDCAHSFSQR